MNGKYHDGNQSGKLTFKIRKNDNLEEYDAKKSCLLKKISEELGLELKKTEVNTKRPITNIIPTNMSIMNGDTEKYFTNNKTFAKKIVKPNIIPIDDKLSKQFPPEINIYYKNTFVNNKQTPVQAKSANNKK